MTRRVVDVHGHVTAPALLARYPMPPSLGDIEGMIERKLAAGIDLTIVGSPVGFGTMTRLAGLDNYAQRPGDLAGFHDWLGETVGRHHDHMRAYAYVNPFGNEADLAAAARLVRHREFVGLIVNTSVRGTYLDDPRADDFFAMVREARVPVVLHPPAEPVGSAALEDFRLVEQVARFSDVTMALATMIMSGRFARDPGLRVLAVTGGGAIALLPARLDLAHAPRHWRPAPGGGPAGPPMPGAQAYPLPAPPSSYLHQIHVDTATHSPAAVRAAVDVLGADHVLFGTDTPPLPHELPELLAEVERLDRSPSDVARILAGNAEALFDLPARALAPAASTPPSTRPALAGIQENP